MVRAIVVGAGIVGLSTAWHLQERGVEVTVVDRTGVAAGSSWGNAGWLTPGMAMPLADPTIWSYAAGAMFDRDAPLHVPFRVDPGLWSFLLRFAAHGTQRAWDRTMAGLTPIDRIAFDAFDELTGNGVDAWTREGPFVVGFETEAQAAPFLHELENVARHGQEVPVTRLHDPQAFAPQLSDGVSTVFRLDGQRFLEPGPFVQALADAVERRGAAMRFGAAVEATSGGDARDASASASAGRMPWVRLAGGERLEADHVVIATGAWLPALTRRLGVRTRVQAGRGYSFTVRTDVPTQHPVYFPATRIACTPYQGRFRIAGTMEFRRPDEAAQARRIDAIVRTARRLFTGVDLDHREDEWVGSRPVTPDGLPLIGATTAPGVFVAGGHGMWGVVLGPATGKLLAERIVTGRTPAELAPFDPLR